MIQGYLRRLPYPAACQILVDALPKEGEVIEFSDGRLMKVNMIADRWGKPYIYLEGIKDTFNRLEGYLEIKS